MTSFNLLLANDFSTALEYMLDEAQGYVTQRGLDFLINLVPAIAIYIVGKWATRLIVRLLNSVMKRSKVDETLAKFLTDIARAVLITLVILMALARLGVNTTSLTAMLGAAGIAVGLALQGSLSNFAAGVMLILFKPFRVGDFVEAAGTSGTVEQISIFNTLMRTGDNKQVIVPNGGIISGNIINFSAKLTRRIDPSLAAGTATTCEPSKRFWKKSSAPTTGCCPNRNPSSPSVRSEPAVSTSSSGPGSGLLTTGPSCGT